MGRFQLPKSGQYADWEKGFATRYPLALSEMQSPSVPVDRPDACALARWGIECGAGWRPVLEYLLGELEAAIAAQPAECRKQYRVVQLKEKMGRLTAYLAAEPTPAMLAAIDEAGRRSQVTCDVCSAPGRLEERDGSYRSRCTDHMDWSPWQRSD